MFLFCPLLAGFFFTATRNFIPYLLFGGALFVMALGLSLYRGEDTAWRPIGRHLIAVAAVFGLVFIWCLLANHYVAATDYRQDFFRLVLPSRQQVPIYGAAASIRGAGGWAAVALGLTGAGCWLWWRRPMREGATPTTWLVEVTAVYAFVIFCFALTEGGRLGGYFAHLEAFAQAAEGFASVTELLGTFVQRMNGLNFRAAHYPPGYIAVLVWERGAGVVGLLKLLNYGAALSVPLLVWRFAGCLGFSAQVRRTTVLLSITCAPLIVFPSTAGVSILAVLMCVALLGVLRFLGGGGWWHAATAGGTLAVFWFTSFSAAVASLLLGCVALAGVLTGAWSWRRTLLAGGWVAVCALTPFLLLYSLSGFDVLACMRTSVANNQAGMGDGWDTLTRWSLRSSGNLLAFVAVLGPAQIGSLGSLTRNWSQGTSTWRAVVIGLLIVFAFSAGSGLYCSETERVWLFLTPLLVGVCGSAWQDRSMQARLPQLLLWSLLFAGIYEAGFRHHL